MAGDGRGRQQPSSARVDETIYYSLSVDNQPRTARRKTQESRPRHPGNRVILAALALSLLVTPGCQNNFPTGRANPAPSVTLALLGDVMLGRGVHPSSETFAYLKPYLISADLALANLESPLTDSAVQT